MQTHTSPNPATSIAQIPPIRCLLVDDEPLILLVLTNFLSKISARLTKVANATDAITAFETEEFDILITDRFMPGMDGMTLAKILKRRHPRLKTVVISGVPPSSTTQIDAFLQKPFDQDILLETIARLTSCKTCPPDELPKHVPLEEQVPV